MGPLVTARAPRPRQRLHRRRRRRRRDARRSTAAASTVAGHEDGFFLGPTLFDHVTPEMTIYTDEIFGPVLVVVRANTLDEAIDARQPQSRTATAPRSSRARAAPRGGSSTRSKSAWSASTCRFRCRWRFFSFGGWKQSLFGDLHVHGMEGVKFYTRTKAITTRWPKSAATAPT